MQRYEKLDLLGQTVELHMGFMYHAKDMKIKLIKFEKA